MVYLVYWASEFNCESEDVCVCTTEELAKAKCAELGNGYNYKVLPIY